MANLGKITNKHLTACVSGEGVVSKTSVDKEEDWRCWLGEGRDRTTLTPMPGPPKKVPIADTSDSAVALAVSNNG